MTGELYTIHSLNWIFAFALSMFILEKGVPSVLTIVATPLKKPLNFGFGCVWSWINLTLIVSIGHTTRIASDTPAPRPARTVWICVNFPLSSTIWFLKYSKAANLKVREELLTFIFKGVCHFDHSWGYITGFALVFNKTMIDTIHIITYKIIHI